MPPVRSIVRVLMRSRTRTYSGSRLAAAALVGQALPAAPDAEDLVAEVGGAVDDALDDRVEAGDVAAAGEDADPPRCCHVRAPLGPPAGRRRAARRWAQRGASRRTDAPHAGTGSGRGHPSAAAGSYDRFHELRAVHGRGARRGSAAALRRGRRRSAPSRSWTRRWSRAARNRVGELDDPTAHAGDRRPPRGGPPARDVDSAGRHRVHDPRALPDVRWSAARLRCGRARLCRPEPVEGAAGTVIQLAQQSGLGRRLHVVSGIRREEAEELIRGSRRGADAGPPERRGWRAFGILSRGEVSEWLMVPLSKSGVRKHRGFESRPLRHSRPGPARQARRPGRILPAERSPSGLGRRTGNAVWGNPSRVQIPPSPPRSHGRGRHQSA